MVPDQVRGAPSPDGANFDVLRRLTNCVTFGLVARWRSFYSEGDKAQGRHPDERGPKESQSDLYTRTP